MPSTRPEGVSTVLDLKSSGAKGVSSTKPSAYRCGRGVPAEQEGAVQAGELFAHKAAVVQRAAGVEQYARVPVGSQTHLAEIEVEVAALQSGNVILPRQLAHCDRQRGGRELGAEAFGHRTHWKAFSSFTSSVRLRGRAAVTPAVSSAAAYSSAVVRYSYVFG